MRILSVIVDLLGGLFLILAGALLLVLYVGFRAKADSWFISFLLILFLIGLGLGGIGLGLRRLYATFRKLLKKQ